MGVVLLCHEGEVEDYPAWQPGAHLVEAFYVDCLVQPGEIYPGVEFSADEEVVEHVACVSAFGEFAVSWIRLACDWDAEGGQVDIDGLCNGDEEVGCDNLIQVGPDEGPDGERCALQVGPDCEAGEDEDVRREGVEFVAVSSPGAQECPVDLMPWESELQEQA